MKFTSYSLTLGQQGGIGWPPSVIRLDKPYKGRKIYGIKGSREKRMPTTLEPYSMHSSLWKRKETHWRHQIWIYKQWYKAPKISWDELEKITEERKGE